ncbi:hypothetical protein MO867_18060 [Microbulbifer sp. OS29]|uniref:Uncharacterized protein n=1 Tax=Microbulbifer okhotskensis TaxID=2926617 RepID=A0A9X2J760_9GAMM|nr:hypothetical protein [Microbulbifer okhotskensis]MCO1336239.1 hypothetical protein [Microbulbifer okhotskensis]
MSNRVNARERQIEGLEHLVGLLLAYVQYQPNYSPEDLQALMNAQLVEHMARDAHDPFLDPFERIEAMLRCHEGQPVHPDDQPTEFYRGFPMPSLKVLQDWLSKQKPR